MMEQADNEPDRSMDTPHARPQQQPLGAVALEDKSKSSISSPPQSLSRQQPQGRGRARGRGARSRGRGFGLGEEVRPGGLANSVVETPKQPKPGGAILPAMLADHVELPAAGANTTEYIQALKVTSSPTLVSCGIATMPYTPGSQSEGPRNTTANSATGIPNSPRPATMPNESGTRSLLFSSLPQDWTTVQLEIYCDTLGDDVDVECIDMLGTGKARAVLSGLTAQEISRIETKTHKSKKSVFSVQVEHPLVSEKEIVEGTPALATSLYPARQVVNTTGTLDTVMSYPQVSPTFAARAPIPSRLVSPMQWVPSPKHFGPLQSPQTSTQLSDVEQVQLAGQTIGIQSPLSTQAASVTTNTAVSVSEMPPLQVRECLQQIQSNPPKDVLQDTSDGAIPKEIQGTNFRVLHFSSLPPEVSKTELEIYCGALGNDVIVLSIDILGGGKAKAVVSGLTNEEVARAEGKTHRARGSVFTVQLEPVSSGSSQTTKLLNGCTSNSTIEVQDIPESYNKSEFLEMYFEKSKAGGAEGCLKDIKIVGAHTAHLIFHEPTVAARVLAKGPHIVLGQQLKLQFVTASTSVQKEYELDRLFVRKIPSKVTKQYLHLYFCQMLGVKAVEIRQDGDAAVLVLPKEYPIKELEQMVACIQNNLLDEAKLEAKLYKVCSSVRLSNVTDASHYNENFIKTYFESSQSGGDRGKAVKTVELLGNGEAIVFFKDPKDARVAIEHTHSTVFGEGVSVELNDQLCIAKQEQQVTTVADSKNTNASASKSTNICKITVEPLVVSSSKMGGLSEYIEAHLHVKLDYETTRGEITVIPTKSTPAGWRETCKTEINEYIKENHTIAENIKIPTDATVELIGQLANFQSESKSFVYRFGKNLLSIAGERQLVDSAKLIIKEISDRYSMTTLHISLTLEEFSFLTNVKLASITKDFPQVEVSPQARDHSLTTKGTVKNVQEFQQALQELKVHLSVSLTTSTEIIAFFQGVGRQELQTFVRNHSYPLAIHHEASGISFLCETTQREVANKAVSKVQESTSVLRHPLPESFVTLKPQPDDFVPLCRELEAQNKVTIASNKSELKIVGFNAGVEQSKTHLQEYIKEKCMVEVSVPVELGIWRLLKSHMIYTWQRFIEKCKKHDIAYQEPSKIDDDNCGLIFKGDQISVQQIFKEFSSMQEMICKRDIVKSQPGTCKFFRSENARAILYGIEAQKQVTIELTEPEEEEAFVPASPSFSAKFEKKCMAQLPKGGKKITVYVGDITEFDRSDVIVNAANEDLKHIGGVALAIANKGGPVIQSNSDSYVRKYGRVDTGDVWVTEEVGNLPCKAVVHAVGPRWSGGSRKEEALLKKACLQSLQASDKKFRSISFPAISSGVYGFPLSKCAETMVKAFIDYSKQHSGSKMQDINIILFKPTDSSAFISALQANLPGTNIDTGRMPTSAATIYKEPSTTYIGATPKTTPMGRKKRSKSGGSSESFTNPASPIILHRGGLLDVKADAYVNSTNPQIDLSHGAVAQSLLKAGGRPLQDACTAKTKATPLNAGEVVETEPGNIQCKYILHTVVPGFDGAGGKAEKVLRRAIRSCLEKCSILNVSSVAFPSIGTGNLRFPNDVVAKVMVEEINSFFASDQSSSLTAVYLVIFMADTYKAFQTAIKDSPASIASSYPIAQPAVHQALNVPKQPRIRRVKNRAQPSVTPSNASAFSIGQLTLSIIQGDISEEATDVIVVPTNAHMSLTGQGVAGAILKKGGPDLQRVCDSVITNIGKLSEGKVATTSATGTLKCKSLFHIVFEGKDDKKFIKVITECLQEADKQAHQSVSFPAVGTGIYGYPPQVAAVGIFKAIEQFSHSAKLKHLKQIQLVLYLPDVYNTFMQVFQNPAAFEKPGLFGRGISAIKSILPASFTSSFESATPLAMPFIPHETDQDEELVIKVYGENEQLVDAAEIEIDKLIAKTFITKKVEHLMVTKLGTAEVSTLQRKAKELGVKLDIDQDPALSMLKIKGDERDVHKMHSFVTELLSDIERAVKKADEAQALQKTIQWLRVDSNGDEEEYSIEENFEIESAFRYRSGQGTYKHTSDSDLTDFTIDFTNNVEIDHTKSNTKTNVKRVDLLKKIQEEVPKEWDKMPTDPSTGKEAFVHIVDLSPTSQEYQDIQLQFDKTMQQQPSAQGKAIKPLSTGSRKCLYNSIIKIQRIQNPTLYSQYIARKKEMDKLNPPTVQNERKLFHGTRLDTCPKVNHGGFNRSYCGLNATVYGKGVYFARDAEYSARDTYSPRDGNGHKYMYLARVLTGEFTLGAVDMLVPPPKDPSKNAHITYDSVVNNVASPVIFVVFQDAQNYPEYLITFS